MGASADPETGMIYVPSVSAPYVSSVQPGGTRSEMPYIAGGGRGSTTVLGLPLLKGPYGSITAIDLNTGRIRPSGKFLTVSSSAAILDNPQLKASRNRSWQVGQGSERSPILVTKTMLIEGSDNLLLHRQRRPARSFTKCRSARR